MADGRRHGDASLEVLQMKMEAMTRAAKAKDAEVAAMQAELRKGRERERRLEAELAEVKSRLERAEIAEERLAADMADLEAEALERALAHKSQVESLAADLREKEKLLAAAAAADQLKLMSISKGNDLQDARKDALHASLLERASKSRQEGHDEPTSLMKLSWWRWSQQRPTEHEHHSTHIVKHLTAPPSAPKDLRTPLTTPPPST